MNPTFEEIRAKLTTLTNQITSVSNAIVDKGGSRETHLPDMATAISNLWTGGDGIVWTEVDENYNPISIEYRCSTYNSITEFKPTTVKHIRVKPTPKLISDGFNITGFSGKNTLETVELFDAYETHIGANAFQRCMNLTSIKLGNTTTFGNMCFMLCVKLESIDVKNLTSIGNQAFYFCSKLKSITLRSNNPSNVTISSNAFSSVRNPDIYVSWSEGAVSGAPWGASGATMHYNVT